MRIRSKLLFVYALSSRTAVSIIRNVKCGFLGWRRNNQKRFVTEELGLATTPYTFIRFVRGSNLDSLWKWAFLSQILPGFPPVK
jgi:hypothetical protein